eukprot:jgi/Chrpa1/9619/Chrysochromulina_OHIO_Genome00004444-RA
MRLLLAAAMLGGSPIAATRTCASWCESPCSMLNGIVEAECGGCPDDPRYLCRRGAEGFSLDKFAALRAIPHAPNEIGAANNAPMNEAAFAQLEPLTPVAHDAVLAFLRPSAEVAELLPPPPAGFLVGFIDGRLSRVRVWCDAADAAEGAIEGTNASPVTRSALVSAQGQTEALGEASSSSSSSSSSGGGGAGAVSEPPPTSEPPPFDEDILVRRSGAVVESLDDGSSYRVDDASASLSRPLRLHAARLCRATVGGIGPRTPEGEEEEEEEEEEEWRANLARLLTWPACGAVNHMYDHNKNTKHKDEKVDLQCRRERHLRAYGDLGLPVDQLVDPPSSPPNDSSGHSDASVSPTAAPSMGTLASVSSTAAGNFRRLGLQGQPRKTVPAFKGCDDEALARALMTNQPIVMRGCLSERSPRALTWSTGHLLEVAANHTTRICPDRLGDYLLAGMPYYRHCGGLPAALLADVALPPPLHALQAHEFDNVVLWTGNLSHTRTSPLHFDPQENLMHLIDGEKHLLLIDPVESVLLYADFESRSLGNTPVDPARVDLKRFPLAARVALWPVTLRPGDVLLIPSGWWHIVTTRRGRNVALTLQFQIAAAAATTDPATGFSTTGFTFLHAQEKLRMRHSGGPRLEELLPKGCAGRGAPSSCLAEARTLADVTWMTTAQLL